MRCCFSLVKTFSHGKHHGTTSVPQAEARTAGVRSLVCFIFSQEGARKEMTGPIIIIIILSFDGQFYKQTLVPAIKIRKTEEE